MGISRQKHKKVCTSILKLHQTCLQSRIKAYRFQMGVLSGHSPEIGGVHTKATLCGKCVCVCVCVPVYISVLSVCIYALLLISVLRF